MSAREEQRRVLVEAALQAVFQGYNMPRDRYPDDYSYSIFQGKKLSEAFSLLQRATGRAIWASDNVPLEG